MLVSEWLFPHRNVAANLPDAPQEMRFLYALRHGSMKLGLYAPKGQDPQGPHKQDELYVVPQGQAPS